MRAVEESGKILHCRDDGRFTVGTTWDSTCGVADNQDEHGCMHSLPVVDVLGPGQSAEMNGRIVLVEGGVDECLSELRA